MGWSVCPHDDDGYCVLLKDDCKPSTRGCVLYRAVSQDTLVGRREKEDDGEPRKSVPDKKRSP